MNEQWKQLKDTIVDIRDNNEFEHEDVTLMCRFLVNYMDVLEKQMQAPKTGHCEVESQGERTVKRNVE